MCQLGVVGLEAAPATVPELGDGPLADARQQVVCWDADLRRSKGAWSAHKISGANWQRDRRLDVAKNGYRVLLTRARKGMLIFVPRGDLTGEDATRCPAYYDGIADFLKSVDQAE